MVLRYANAIEGRPGMPGMRYAPCVFDLCDSVAMVKDARYDGWVYITELFESLPEDLQKQVIFHS
jgi:hypothetical protein